MKKLLPLVFLLLLLFSCKKELTSAEKHAQGLDADPEIIASLEKFSSECEGIFESDDGNLISIYPAHEEEDYLENVRVFEEFAKSADVDVFVAVPPRKMDALSKSLPDTFPREHSMRLNSLLELTLDKAKFIDLYPALSGKSEYAGELYFKTDHHWTADGAYLAYVEIADAMGYKPYDKDFFKTEVLLEEFRGSDFTKKNTSESVDRVIGVYPEGDYTTQLLTSQGEITSTFDGFFDYSKAKTNEPYAVYLGGNAPYVRVSCEGSEREVLLLVRDSFASALAPYLASHFDLVLIDARFFPVGISQVAKKEGAKKILILENMGSITEHTLRFMW